MIYAAWRAYQGVDSAKFSELIELLRITPFEIGSDGHVQRGRHAVREDQKGTGAGFRMFFMTRHCACTQPQ